MKRALPSLVVLCLVMVVLKPVLAETVGSVLKADLIEWDLNTNKFTASGHCLLELPEGRLTCAKVVAALDSKLAQVTDAVASGEVTFKGSTKDKQGRLTHLSGQGQQARYSLKTGELAFSGAVVFQATGGGEKPFELTLKGPKVAFAQKTQQLKATGCVLKVVSTTPAGKRTGSLEAASLLYSLATGALSATGKVKLQVPEGTLQAPKLTAKISDEGQGITSAEAGTPCILDAELARAEGPPRKLHGTATQASYEGKTGKITLDGQVVLKLEPVTEGQPPATLTGAKMVLLLKEGRLLVEQGEVTGTPQSVGQ